MNNQIKFGPIICTKKCNTYANWLKRIHFCASLPILFACSHCCNRRLFCILNMAPTLWPLVGRTSSSTIACEDRPIWRDAHLDPRLASFWLNKHKIVIVVWKEIISSIGTIYAILLIPFTSCPVASKWAFSSDLSRKREPMKLSKLLRAFRVLRSLMVNEWYGVWASL